MKVGRNSFYFGIEVISLSENTETTYDVQIIVREITRKKPKNDEYYGNFVSAKEISVGESRILESRQEKYVVSLASDLQEIGRTLRKHFRE